MISINVIIYVSYQHIMKKKDNAIILVYHLHIFLMLINIHLCMMYNNLQEFVYPIKIKHFHLYGIFSRKENPVNSTHTGW